LESGKARAVQPGDPDATLGDWGKEETRRKVDGILGALESRILGQGRRKRKKRWSSGDRGSRRYRDSGLVWLYVAKRRWTSGRSCTPDAGVDQRGEGHDRSGSAWGGVECICNDRPASGSST
jgi:hypothetical protein